eukprot:gene5389-7472_t
MKVLPIYSLNQFQSNGINISYLYHSKILHSNGKSSDDNSDKSDNKNNSDNKSKNVNNNGNDNNTSNNVNRKAIIVPSSDSNNSLRFFNKVASDAKNSIQQLLDLNWKTGLCKHKITFESTDIIRRLKFYGDLLSFGLIDGRVCLIRISTGQVLDKFNDHKSEVTSIDFDGTNLCSGSADGDVSIYKLTYETPSKFGKALHRFRYHNRAVSGLQIIRMSGKDNDSQTNVLVSCSMDQKLIAVNMASGKIMYSVDLNGSPLCLGNAGKYLAVGMRDGKVKFINAFTGDMILQFQAHADRVRSIHFLSEVVLITGSNKGVVKRWDLSGRSPDDNDNDNEKIDEDLIDIDDSSNNLSDNNVYDNDEEMDGDQIDELKSFHAPSRFIDYYFSEAILQNTKSDSLNNKNINNNRKNQTSNNNNNNNNNNNEKNKSMASTKENPNNSTMFGNTTAVSDPKVKSMIGSSISNAIANTAVAAAQSAVAAISKLGRAKNNNNNNVMANNPDNNDEFIYKNDDKSEKKKLYANDPSPVDKRVDHFYREDLKGAVPVVSVQGDNNKILAAYEDGVIVSWDTKTKEVNFELQGRSNLISTLQFDMSRLIADGSNNVIVAHDFGDPPLEPEELVIAL